MFTFQKWLTKCELGERMDAVVSHLKEFRGTLNGDFQGKSKTSKGAFWWIKLTLFVVTKTVVK